MSASTEFNGLADEILQSGLRAFGEELDAYPSRDHDRAFEHEHVLHFCLALGLNRAWQLPPGSVEFERLLGDRGRLDLWIAPHHIAVEVKYLRPMPSGQGRPFPQLYGSLLADFNRVAAYPGARERLVILVTDERMLRYIRDNGRELLPLTVGLTTQATSSIIETLSKTASGKAMKDAPWTALATTLEWSHQSSGLRALAWRVNPA